jgi:hypothetical protein
MTDLCRFALVSVFTLSKIDLVKKMTRTHETENI